jgi:hypothetical protein
VKLFDENLRNDELIRSVDLLAAILRLTLPKGVGPFVEKLTALGSILNTDAALSATGPVSKLRKQSTR